VVRGLAPAHGGDDAGRDPDQRPDQQREARELERDRQPRDDRVRDGELAGVDAEIAAHGEPDPVPVLDRQRLVEPILVPDLREQRRIAALAAERERRVARQRANPEEDEDAREEEDDQSGSDLAQEEAAHDRLLSARLLRESGVLGAEQPVAVHAGRRSPSSKRRAG